MGINCSIPVNIPRNIPYGYPSMKYPIPAIIPSITAVKKCPKNMLLSTLSIWKYNSLKKSFLSSGVNVSTYSHNRLPSLVK